jgi:hypothetical protein
MDHTLNDTLDARLRAARPAAAVPDADAGNEELLARIRRQPIARRSFPRGAATPLIACAAVAAVAAVMFGGGPGNVGGPSTASAVTAAALRWFAPPAGTVLHTQSIETRDGRTIRREFWQSADHPDQMRLVVDAGAGRSYEVAGTQLYDPQTNTIYDEVTDKGAGGSAAPARTPPDSKGAVDPADAKAAAIKADPTTAEAVRAAEAKAAAAKGNKATGEAADPATAKAREDKRAAVARQPEISAGDPIIGKIRFALGDGAARVTGHEVHHGVDAWTISLDAGQDRQAWTLWVDRADGRPLELYDPEPSASGQSQTIRWTAYDVLQGTDALVSLDQAHPSARHATGAGEYTEAQNRLMG